MSDYIVSARKYRPSNFRSVVGQKSLTSTLKNAIETGRLAQAYLFCGPRGVGKTSCARIFAKTINCLHPTPDGDACGECESCKSIEQGNSFNIIELDAASNNSVDDIRTITEEVKVPPQVGNYRVFIIDEVHMLSSAAFNAFLKTLEEPPKYAIFILATTEKHKVIPTILSRCQIYDFKRITTADMVEHLQYVAEQENIKVTADALNVIARKADGAMRDALSIFDQVAASSMGDISYQSTLANLNVLDYDYYFNIVESFRAGDAGQALLIYNEIQERGFDSLFFINGLASHIRDLMVAADTRTAKLLEVAEEVVEKYTSQARSLPLQWYFSALKLINDCDYAYRTATNKQLHVELMLIRLSQLLTPPTFPFDRVDSEPPLEAPKTYSKAQSDVKAVAQETSRQSTKPVTEVKITEDIKPKDHPKPLSEAIVPPIENKTVKKSSVKKTTRLTDLGAEYDKEKEKKKDRRNTVTKEAFMEAWTAYMVSNKEKSMLVEAMRETTPIISGNDEFSVEVAHPAQKQAFDSNLNSLLTFLRDRLENDFVSLKVTISDLSDIKKPMPPKDLFQDILKENPSIGGIARMLDVEII